ncbi:MAG: DUF2793 domain-containing protein [Flavobacteriales bacterium]|nr:DUF2793 domain-containing protein [Flavobacteriales bacterium]
MPILHKNITNATDIHNPKWLSTANNGDYAWKNEKGELESTDEIVLPAALNFVDASIAPPTSNNGDIYILSSGGSVNAGWGSVAVGDWVRYDGALWNSITPQKSTLCYDETADTLNSFDGSAWSAIGGASGILGISDASGAYTYYTTYTLAMAAASSGDTIEQFGNITETGNVTITIPDEVSINMNGYTYTLDGSDNDLFIKNGVGTKTKFINGTIIKQNSPTPNGGGNGLTVTQSAELDCTGLTVISDGTAVLNFNTTSSGQGLITKGNFIYNGTNTGFISFIEGRLDNAFINTGTGIIRVTGDGLYNSTIYGAIATTSAAVLKNCIINNTLASVGLTLSGAKAYNCNVYSQSSNAIFLNNAVSECHNSIGKSDSGVGIYIDTGKTYNSTGISTTTVGMFVNQTDAEVSFCTGESSAASGFELRVGNIFNSLGKSTYNNALGHGIYVGNNNGTVSNCTGITVNTSAHAIQAGPVNRNVKISNLKGKGMTTLIGDKAINIQTNTADNFGNLLIG